MILLFYAFSELSLLPRQGSEFWKNKKKRQFSYWKMNIFGPEPSKRALHSLGLIGPPLGGAIWPSKLSFFYPKSYDAIASLSFQIRSISSTAYLLPTTY